MATILIDKLLQTVVNRKASDLHITVGQPPVVRLDGRLIKLETKVLEPEDTVALMKSISPERCQQELQEVGGADFGFAFGDQARFRVSIFKQRGNVAMVLRQIPNKLLDFEQLGTPWVLSKLIMRPRGLILVTGPTGSGKSTTLAAAIDYLNETVDHHIITIEDPIEFYHKHKKSTINQREIGVDVPNFAEAIRRGLRQDPDVIMVGEVRDTETANVTLQSALTGHLVLATLHTNDSAGAIARLLELGVDPFILASTLVGVIAQRLVRLVCPNCRTDTFLTPDQMQLIGLDVQELESQGEEPQLQVSVGGGCVKCRQTGLVGRTGVFEVLAIDDKIRKLIIARAPSRDILKQAKNDGLMTLREAAIKKLAKGETCFDEVLRVTVES
jgi:twitching motility protein PilT